MNSKIKKAFAGMLALAVILAGTATQFGGGLMPEIGVTAYAAETTVTWSGSDIRNSGKNPFTKDRVTLTVGFIDFNYPSLHNGGTFKTSFGNFTGIKVTASGGHSALGEGWTGEATENAGTAEWSGNASVVSFNKDIYVVDSIVFTIATVIELNKSEMDLFVDDEETLTATVESDGLADTTVTWTSSDTNVAAVDASGKVTAVGVGEATVTAKITNGTDDPADDYFTDCKVTVAKKAATATCEQVGGDYTSNTETDNVASLWRIYVTPGTDAITKIDVMLGSFYNSDEGTQEIDTPNISGVGKVVLGVVTNISGELMREVFSYFGGFTVIVNDERITAPMAAND